MFYCRFPFQCLLNCIYSKYVRILISIRVYSIGLDSWVFRNSWFLHIHLKWGIISFIHWCFSLSVIIICILVSVFKVYYWWERCLLKSHKLLCARSNVWNVMKHHSVMYSSQINNAMFGNCNTKPCCSLICIAIYWYIYIIINIWIKV